MIRQIDNKTGRNDDCPCGSGKKYKVCCLPNSPPKVLNPRGLQRCFMLLVKAAGGLVVSYEDIANFPKDEALGVKYDCKTDTFRLDVIKVEKKLILTPGRKLI